MDAVKLKNSCICGNTLPYSECCEPFVGEGASGGKPEGRAKFRRDLHDLYMYLFPLRNLYQAYWERLSEEQYPHHLLMADADYGRTVMANFFWDYSVQFSDARPVLRAARDVEEKDLRLANDFRQWSLSPLWLWQVVDAGPGSGHVRMAGSGKVVRVDHGGELPAPGRLFAGRILPHRSRHHVHPAVLTLPAGTEAAAQDRLHAVCRDLGVTSGNGLRPDVQCEEWRRHGSLILGVWREMVYDAHVGLPARAMASPLSFRLPAGETGDTVRQLKAGGAVPLDHTRFDLRYRALTLARLEAEPGDTLQISLLDEAYRPYVFHWLADHLAMSARPPALPAAENTAAEEAAEWLAWVGVSLDTLNGETPQEASRHDFGRRRLRALLPELPLKGEELSALRRHLGL